METFTINEIILFLIFFVPGFISMKVYNLFRANDKINFSESIGEVVSYSAINFAILSSLIFLIHRGGFMNSHPFWYVFFCFIILFVAPILWPIIFIKITAHRKVKKYILSQEKTAWDYIFAKKKGFWVIVNLKSGDRIAGVYGSDSFASSYPNKQQIYLEQQWSVNEKGKFLKVKNRTSGVLLLGDDIKSIEFYT